MTGLRERNKSKRREAILDATMLLLRSNEFADVTIDQVAELAEVSPHTVYNLVGTRDEILYTLMGRVVTHMAATVPLPDDVPDDPSEGLRTLTDHGVDTLLADEIAYRRVANSMTSLPHWPGGGREPIHVYNRAAWFLEAGGVLRPGVTAATVSRHAVLSIFGAMMAWARGQTADGFRVDARLGLALVLAGTTTGAVAERALNDIVELGKRTSAFAAPMTDAR